MVNEAAALDREAIILYLHMGSLIALNLHLKINIVVCSARGAHRSLSAKTMFRREVYNILPPYWIKKNTPLITV